MSRTITCSECDSSYTLADSFRARRAACKKCGHVIEVAATPGADDRAEAAPAPRSRESRPRQQAPRSARNKDRDPRFATTPLYQQPMLYVGIVTTLVCGWFAAHYS